MAETGAKPKRRRGRPPGRRHPELSPENRHYYPPSSSDTEPDEKAPVAHTLASAPRNDWPITKPGLK